MIRATWPPATDSDRIREKAGTLRPFSFVAAHGIHWRPGERGGSSRTIVESPRAWRTEVTEVLAECARPWKLATFFAGLGLLIAGSFYYRAPDWDVPISIIMAMLAYLTASWSLRVILERRWKYAPAMLFLTWFTVDGSYWIYWRFTDPAALDLMRAANFPASLALYGMCGIVWLHRGSLRELAWKMKRIR